MHKRFHVLLFVLRRLIMATCFFFMQQFPSLELILMMQLNVAIMMFMASMRPYLKRSKNRKEVVNEAFVLVCCVLLVLFTDFCPNLEFQYFSGGWSYVIIVCICLVLNLIQISSGPLNLLRLHLIRIHKRLMFMRANQKQNQSNNDKKSESASSSESSSSSSNSQQSEEYQIYAI